MWARELNLRLRGSFTNTPDRHRLPAEIHTRLLKPVEGILNGDVIEILATGIVMTIYRFHVENTVVYLQS